MEPGKRWRKIQKGNKDLEETRDNGIKWTKMEGSPSKGES